MEAMTGGAARTDRGIHPQRAGTMAENKLEGFEDFENVLGDAEGQGGGAAEFAGELDNLLGAETGKEGAPAEGGQGDSELDSFFEDLSTIDDLEVLQEDESAAPAAAAPAPEPEAEEEEEPAPRAAPAAAAAPRARPARQPRQRKPRGFFGRWIRRLIVLAILIGGGYYAYQFFFPDLQPPWDVMEKEKGKLVSLIQEKLPKQAAPKMEPKTQPLPPPPPVAMQPRPRPRPVPKAAPPRPKPVAEHGPWSIQVATCFFPSCVESYRAYLEGQRRSVLVQDRTSQSESLEIYSISTFRERDQAQELADTINREHPLEGHAFIFREEGGYRISMGAFSDLGRANIVKDALNQKHRGEIAFGTRVKDFPYKLQTVLTGRFPSREAAEQALGSLKNAEPRLKDAFVMRNQ
jgi:SPOR domain